jgi:hypothetical protein
MVSSPVPAEPASLPGKFEPDSYYQVDLLKPFTMGERMHKPGENIQLRGDKCEEFRDSLQSAVKVE